MPIAFDAVDNGAVVNPGTSVSWPHNCSAAATVLLAAVQGDTAADLVTSVTYAGVQMTKLDVTQIPTGRFFSLWGLLNPKAGVNTIQANASASIFISGAGSSYKGVGSIESAAHGTTASGISVTAAITTVAAGCWLAGLSQNDQGNPCSGAGLATRNQTNGDGGEAELDTNGGKSPGTYNFTCGDNTIAANWGLLVASLAPPAPPAAAGGTGSSDDWKKRRRKTEEARKARDRWNDLQVNLRSMIDARERQIRARETAVSAEVDARIAAQQAELEAKDQARSDRIDELVRRVKVALETVDRRRSARERVEKRLADAARDRARLQARIKRIEQQIEREDADAAEGLMWLLLFLD